MTVTLVFIVRELSFSTRLKNGKPRVVPLSASRTTELPLKQVGESRMYK
jgi:hypothetical protein